MKAVFAVLVLAAVASAATFDQWASANGKGYTAAERVRRQAVFTANMDRAAKLNQEHAGFATFGATKFADLTEEEFASIYLGTRPSNVPRTEFKVRADLPTAFDWREKTNPAVVTKVKDQKTCGSCWAFSTVVHLEGLAAQRDGKMVEMSEQQLVDCDHECQDDGSGCDAGCNGGWMITAMRYALANGVETETQYKYVARDQTCKYDAKKVAVEFTGNATTLPEGAEDQLQTLVHEVGPIAIAVNANPFQLYFGGILTRSCPGAQENLNHGVGVVGWGHDDAKDIDYWIIRNSWGASWGEEGYIRVKMGDNLCGVATVATYIDTTVTA